MDGCSSPVVFKPGPQGPLSCMFEMFLCSGTPDSNECVVPMLGAGLKTTALKRTETHRTPVWILHFGWSLRQRQHILPQPYASEFKSEWFMSNEWSAATDAPRCSSYDLLILNTPLSVPAGCFSLGSIRLGSARALNVASQSSLHLTFRVPL